MTTVVASIGSNHFPCIANPQTPAADPIPGSPPSLAVGTPTPAAAAGCIGALTIQGVNISGAGGSNGVGSLDLTTWGNKDIIAAINGLTNVSASVNRDGKISLSTPTNVPIVIAGNATVLAALGLTAGNYNG
jgi:hypothetical protein